VTAIAAVDHGQSRHLVGQDDDLLQRRRQGMAVMGGAGEAAGADHEASVEGGGETGLGAELAADAGLEPIDVEQQKGDCRTGLVGCKDQPFDQARGLSSVQQLGKFISRGELLQRARLLLQLVARKAPASPVGSNAGRRSSMTSDATSGDGASRSCSAGSRSGGAWQLDTTEVQRSSSRPSPSQQRSSRARCV